MVFNGKLFDMCQIIDIINLRLMHWFQAKWPNNKDSVLDFCRFPNVISAPKRMKKIRAALQWSKPPIGFLKFNVDGSAVGKPGPAGIGGVLRDDHENVKIVFSKAVGIMDSNLTELLAVREAFIVFAASKWAKTHSLLIESDSSNVVNWIKCPQSAPWRMKKYISHIESLKLQLSSWHIDHIPREMNDVADSLAKSGVNRLISLFLVYY